MLTAPGLSDGHNGRDIFRKDGTFDGIFSLNTIETNYPCGFQGVFRFLSSQRIALQAAPVLVFSLPRA